MKKISDGKEVKKSNPSKLGQKKPYHKPLLVKLGDLVTDTLPGGSKGTEGGSGKGHQNF